jgi:hypothetical protein
MSRSAKGLVFPVALGVLGLVGWWVWPDRFDIEGERGPVGGVPRGVAVQAGLAASAGQFPPAEYPAVATERLIRVSLGLLAKNGADLSKPMPSRHRVLAANPEVVERLATWGRSAGYEATEPVRYHEHGGVEHFQLDLVRTGVPEPRLIEAQGREVFAAVGRIPGAHYQTWEGAIVR